MNYPLHDCEKKRPLKKNSEIINLWAIHCLRWFVIIQVRLKFNRKRILVEEIEPKNEQQDNYRDNLHKNLIFDNGQKDFIYHNHRNTYIEFFALKPLCERISFTRPQQSLLSSFKRTKQQYAALINNIKQFPWSNIIKLASTQRKDATRHLNALTIAQWMHGVEYSYHNLFRKTQCKGRSYKRKFWHAHELTTKAQHNTPHCQRDCRHIYSGFRLKEES